jgi:hypothetical protein
MLPINRPDSWNFKMLSGAPLILDAQFDQLLANGLRCTESTVPVVKIFLPHVRWLLVSMEPDLDTVFAVTMIGAREPEAGRVSLADIVAARLGRGDFGVRPERDKYITLDQPWGYYLRHGDE